MGQCACPVGMKHSGDGSRQITSQGQPGLRETLSQKKMPNITCMFDYLSTTG